MFYANEDESPILLDSYVGNDSRILALGVSDKGRLWGRYWSLQRRTDDEPGQISDHQEVADQRDGG